VERPTERRHAGERVPLDAARVCAVVASGEERPPTHAAAIVDVSLRGVGLRVPVEAGLRPGGLIELGIDGGWSIVRVIWTSPGLHDDVVVGVEFAEDEPAFLPALVRWSQNYAAWRDDDGYQTLIL
jgi:PilZ domain